MTATQMCAANGSKRRLMRRTAVLTPDTTSSEPSHRDARVLRRKNAPAELPYWQEYRMC